MNIGSRNARLRKTLEGMGLYVLPIFSREDSEKIEYMQVSAALPSHIAQGVTEDATSGPVTLPMACAEIGDNIRPTQASGNGVVNFPTKR